MEKKKLPMRPYIRFAALGFQMLAVVVLAALGGDYLDKKYSTLEYRIFTISLVLLGLVLFMYLLLKALKQENKEDENQAS